MPIIGITLETKAIRPLCIEAGESRPRCDKTRLLDQRDNRLVIRPLVPRVGEGKDWARAFGDQILTTSVDLFVLLIGRRPPEIRRMRSGMPAYNVALSLQSAHLVRVHVVRVRKTAANEVLIAAHSHLVQLRNCMFQNCAVAIVKMDRDHPVRKAVILGHRRNCFLVKFISRSHFGHLDQRFEKKFSSRGRNQIEWITGQYLPHDQRRLGHMQHTKLSALFVPPALRSILLTALSLSVLSSHQRSLAEKPAFRAVRLDEKCGHHTLTWTSLLQRVLAEHQLQTPIIIEHLTISFKRLEQRG
jgi:hypothetical protein